MLDPRFFVSGTNPYKSFVPNKDVTEILTQASSTLTFEKALHTSSSYNPDNALHVIELMDTRMDPCAVMDPSSGAKLPSVRERIENGTLPFPSSLGVKESTRVLDHILLQLYPSYLHGNSAPQTLMSSLYLHPTSLSTLATESGKPSLYLHTRVPGAETMVPLHNLHFAEISGIKTESAPSVPQPATVPSKLKSDFDQALTLSFFAICLGVLKASGVTYEQILFSDIFEEEDFHPLTYGADMAWAVPLEQVMKTLIEAECALIKCVPGAGAAAQALVDAASSDRDKVLKGTSIQSGAPSALSAMVTALFDLTEGTPRQTELPPQLTSLLSNLSLSTSVSEEAQRVKKGTKKGGNKAVIIPTTTTASVPTPSSSGVPLPVQSKTLETLDKVQDLFSLDPMPDSHVSSISLLSEAVVLIVRIRFLRAYHSALEYFSPRNTTPAKAPLKWGQLFPLERGHTAFVSAWLHMEVIGATSSLVPTTPFGKAYEQLVTLQDLLIDSTLSSSSSLTKIKNESSLKKQIGKNPKPSPPKIGSSAVSTKSQEMSSTFAGFFPEYDKLFLTNNRPRFVPVSDAVSSIKMWQRHLCAASFVTQFPALASHNPHRPMSTLTNVGIPFTVSSATVEMNAMLTTSRALQSSGVSGREVPLPTVPDSGIVDPPLQWPGPFSAIEAIILSKEETTLVSDALKEDIAAAAANASPRRHVSLFAVHSLLELFSRRSPDVLARSLLIRTVLCGGSNEEIEKASATVRDPNVTSSTLSSLIEPSIEAESGGVTSENELKLLQAGDVMWKQGHVRSQVVVGTHTLLELLSASMLDIGTPLELLFTVEGRSFLDLTESIMSNTLRLLQCSRSRMRQQMTSNVHEWAIVCADAEYLGKMWSKQYEMHQKRLAKSSLAELSPEELVDQRLFFLFNSQNKVIDTFSCWADHFAMTSLLLHTRIGIESELYHNDEALSVQWQIIHLLRRLLRSGTFSEIGRTLVWMMPELNSISSYTMNQFKTTGEAHLFSVDLRDNIEEDNEASATEPAADPLVDPSWTEYMNNAMKLSFRRRSAFIESASRTSELVHAEAVLRVLISAKMCGVWNGLGVEGCGGRNDEELNSVNFTFMHRVSRWSVPEFNPHSLVPFRLPSVAFSLRWELFREFPSLAREGNFAKYLLLFGATATPESQTNLARQSLAYARECIKELKRVQELCSLILDGRVDNFREQHPSSYAPEQSSPCSLSSFSILMAGNDINLSLAIEKSITSVNSVAEEFANIDQIVALTEQKPLIKSNFALSNGLRYLRDYRCKIVDEEEKRWALKGIVSERAGCATGPDVLKLAQVRHTVALRKLELYEKEMTAAYNLEKQNGQIQQIQKKSTEKSKPSSSPPRIESIDSSSLLSVMSLPHRQSLSSPALYNLLQTSSERLAILRQSIAANKAQEAQEGGTLLENVFSQPTMAKTANAVIEEISSVSSANGTPSSSHPPTITVFETVPHHPCKLKIGIVPPYFLDFGFDLPFSAANIGLLQGSV